MIDLTRLNGHRLIVNCDLVKFVEATPDTTINLVTGERIIVRESCDQLLALVAEWRAHILRLTWPDSATVQNAQSALGAVHAHDRGGEQSR
jgi:flagellar protein FlbD